MNDTLKVAGRIGAELGAAKAENDRLRAEVEALRVALLGIAQVNPAERCIEWAKSYASDGLSGTGSELYIRWLETFKEAEALRKDADRRATLSQQPEPTETYTAVDMATAAAQGFRDGQAAVEQAAAQDERKTFEVEIPDISAIYDGRSFIPYRSLEAGERLMTAAQHLRIEKQLRAALTRPAPIEQQPAYVECRECTDCGHVGINDAHPTDATCAMCDWSGPSPVEDQCPDCGKENAMGAACPKCSGRYRILAETHVAAPIAQTAPQGKFRMGDLVKKSTGSEWEGRICGTYYTALTQEGYAVESEAHAGSVQIYPAKALEAVA